MNVKHLHGRPVTCKEYCYWFCECVERFRARPSALRSIKDVSIFAVVVGVRIQSFFQVVATVYYTTVIRTIIENYKAGLATVIVLPLTFSFIIKAFEQDPDFWRDRTAIHETLLAECFEKFDTETKQGRSVFDDLHSYFLSILQSQLNVSERFKVCPCPRLLFCPSRRHPAHFHFSAPCPLCGHLTCRTSPTFYLIHI